MKTKAKDRFQVVCHTCGPYATQVVEGKRKLMRVLASHMDEAYYSKMKGKSNAKSS